MDMFYQEIIDEHSNPERPKSSTEDLIDVMLKKKSSTLTVDSMKAILLDVFSGGISSTGSALVFSMTALLRNQRVMKKAQEEIRRVIGKKGIVNEDDIQNLPYLRLIVKETLRLYPPGPLLVPRVTMGTSILGEDEDHMYMIKPNTIVYVNTWGIGRDPKIWKNPLEFEPERFLERPDYNYAGTQFEYLPFGAGRRICVGIIIGKSNVELGLANLLYSFDWEPPIGMKIEDIEDQPTNGLILTKKNPLYLRPKLHDDFLPVSKSLSDYDYHQREVIEIFSTPELERVISLMNARDSSTRMWKDVLARRLRDKDTRHAREKTE
ncbi:hypothetical protein AgCh_040116 [Apium graveolens]